MKRGGGKVEVVEEEETTVTYDIQVHVHVLS